MALIWNGPADNPYSRAWPALGPLQDIAPRCENDKTQSYPRSLSDGVVKDLSRLATDAPLCASLEAGVVEDTTQAQEEDLSCPAAASTPLIRSVASPPTFPGHLQGVTAPIATRPGNPRKLETEVRGESRRALYSAANNAVPSLPCDTMEVTHLPHNLNEGSVKPDCCIAYCGHPNGPRSIHIS